MNDAPHTEGGQSGQAQPYAAAGGVRLQGQASRAGQARVFVRADRGPRLVSSLVGRPVSGPTPGSPTLRSARGLADPGRPRRTPALRSPGRPVMVQTPELDALLGQVERYRWAGTSLGGNDWKFDLVPDPNGPLYGRYDAMGTLQLWPVDE